ncbi:MAG: hypothetical protein M1823_006003 [Watsoniomyces obsoletus]|nr:MAG: hypothetical protein M1823_006003 [Watsoniomyces obsoletus]
MSSSSTTPLASSSAVIDQGLDPSDLETDTEDADAEEEDEEEEEDDEDYDDEPQYHHPPHEFVDGPCFACLTAFNDPALRKQRVGNKGARARYYKQALRFEECGHTTSPIPTEIEIEEDDDHGCGVDLSTLDIDDDGGPSTKVAGDVTRGGRDARRGKREDDDEDDKKFILFEDVEGYCLACRSRGIGAGSEDVGKSLCPLTIAGGLGIEEEFTYSPSPFSMRGFSGGRGGTGTGTGTGNGKWKARAHDTVSSLETIGEGDFETSGGEEDDD